MKRTSLLVGLLAGTVMFLVGCGKEAVQLDQSWSPPVKITVSQDGFTGSVDLYKWHDTMTLLQQRYDRRANSSTCSIMIRNTDSSNSWTQLPLSGVPSEYNFFAPAFDRANDRVMFEQGYIENDQLMMSAIFVRMTANRGIQIEAERKWITDQKSLLGETPPTVHINNPGERRWPVLGVGIVSGQDMYIPFCVAADVHSGKGPFKNGVFHTADSGLTWQMEGISDSWATSPSMCGTKNYCYYLAQPVYGQGMWFARKSTDGGSWNEPKPITTKQAHVGGRYVALAGDDTIHVCWLDSRHTKRRFSLEGPIFTDDEIAYCQQKDTDDGWTEDVILSKGVLSSYVPSISVEGEKIVVAWSGNQTFRACPHESDPNDIYYATSKDGGKTWAKPLRVTDAAKDGITTGKPQVAVQNRVIHLFYVQGKEDPHLQVSNQGPWPVYYQQRPFPD